jgi:hypothetical protein
MKTIEKMTLCPNKIGHLRLRFGHLRQTGANFAEICGFRWSILPELRFCDMFLAQNCGDRWSGS